MLISWRCFVLAAIFLPLLSAAAEAQKVIVTNAPVGDRIEIVVGGKPTGSVTVDSTQTATAPADLQKAVGVSEMDARVYVDVCSKLHRIFIIERNQLPPAREDGCERRELPGIFWVRPANTLVVNVGGAIPTMLLVKGGYNPNNPGADQTCAGRFRPFRGWRPDRVRRLRRRCVRHRKRLPAGRRRRSLHRRGRLLDPPMAGGGRQLHPTFEADNGRR